MTVAPHSVEAQAPALRIVLGTTNRGKIGELVALLADKWPQAITDAGLASGGWQLVAVSAADTPGGANLGEVDEVGTTVAENAAIKAQAYAQACHEWTLADDTALVVDALGGAPGIHTARFAGPRATAAENRARLLAELRDVPLERRGAHFLCHLALADPTSAIRATSQGRCPGRIRTAPAGEEGFGYDPLFEIIEYRCTFAELGLATKSLLSHRARAMEQMLPQLARLMTQGIIVAVEE
jgi:XTP/dITP diphosphohydrolase